MPQTNNKPVTEHCPLDWFNTDERELARHDDPEKNRLLGQDMLANGQLQAVGATEDGRMIFGHGRWLAAKAAGITTLEVKLYPASLPNMQFKLIRAAENLQRKELTGYRTWLMCADLMSGNPTWQMKDLAEALHLAPSAVTKLLSPSKCIPAAQEALRDGKIGITDCYEISRAPADQQAELLQLKLSGTSRDGLADRVRKQKNQSVPQVRVKRIACPLPSGASVVVSGAELSLDDLIEALGDAQKEARKAREQGLDAKTFSAVMKDKAKRGSQS